MLALRLWEHQLRCERCGGFLPDTTEPTRDADGNVDPVATSHMWRWEMAKQCNSCISFDREAEQHPEHPHARYRLIRRR